MYAFLEPMGDAGFVALHDDLRGALMSEFCW
jgi:hypothetical protein